MHLSICGIRKKFSYARIRESSITKFLVLTKARLKDHGVLWQAHQPAPFSPSIFCFSSSSYFFSAAKRQFFVPGISRWPQYASWNSRIFSCSSISPLLWNTDISGPLRPRSASLGYKAWHHVPLGRLVWTRIMGSSAKEHYLTVYLLSYRNPGAVLSTEISVSLGLGSLSCNHITK